MEELSGRRFLDRFDVLFEQAPRMEGVKNVPTVIQVPRFNLSEAIPDLDAGKKEHKELIDKAIDSFSTWRTRTPPMRRSPSARSRWTPRGGRRRPRRARRRFASSAPTSSTARSQLTLSCARSSGARPSGRRKPRKLCSAKKALKEQRKEQRRRDREERTERGEPSPQAKAKIDAELAVRFNDDLGRKLLERRSGGRASTTSPGLGSSRSCSSRTTPPSPVAGCASRWKNCAM